MSSARFAGVLFTAACLLAALPGLASAATITVNTNYDAVDPEPGTGGCVADVPTPGKCTLRAAIQEANATSLVEDTIIFDATVFKGDTESVIFVGSGMTELNSAAKIISGSCAREGGGTGPCAGIQADPGGTGFTINSDGVSISGLAIGGGDYGIFVEEGGFTATANWIGFNLEGGLAAIGTGIYLAPGTEDATIGGTEAAQRNVFGNLGNGLDIEGASGTTVQGNYFGTAPDGSAPAGNFRDIEVSDSTVGDGAAAEDTEIGATVGAGAVETATCDGGCNVIAASGLGAGIDLQGDGSGQNEAAASGPTVVHGNYIGLNAAGTGVVGSAEDRLHAGEADDVLVGGEASGDANFFAGGSYGVRGEGGDDLEVIGNTIGEGPTGADVTPPATVGILASGFGVSGSEAGPDVAANSVRMTGGVGIEHRFTKAEIINNTVEGGDVGILSLGSAEGSLIGGNVLLAPDEAGIEVRNPDNDILGNEVRASGGVGITVLPGGEFDVSGNLVGGDTAGSENAIFDSSDNAIRIVGLETSFNEARRNRGSGNGAEFIVVRPYGNTEGDPNGGIQSPDVLAAGKTEASGEAEPNAVVRVFRKASEDEGEIAGFLGQATADANGDWKATYAAQPEGTMIVATQSLDGGTSGLSQVATTPPDPPCTVNCGGGGGGGTEPPPDPLAPDTTKPKVTIKKAPKPRSTATTAKFVFSSNEAGSKFRCKLDKKAWTGCKSPKTYRNLKPGKHVFKVKATDSAGSASAVVTRKFTVLAP